MTDPSPLEDLLRATSLRVGRIAIDTMDGENWRASVSHFNGRHIHQPYPFGDPVEALRAALIEDERQGRDVERRYEAAPKLGELPRVPQVAPVDPACAYCNDTGHFYGDPELGPCGCQSSDDTEDLLG